MPIDNRNKITAIIPAAGEPTNKVMINSNLPDTMLPINGKPVIGYILEDLLARNIEKAIITLNTKDTHTEKYVTKKFGSKLTLHIIYNDNYSRGVGYSIYIAKKEIKKDESILIYFGDTIYKDSLSFETDFLIVSDTHESSEKWCFVEKSKKGLKFINKPGEYSGDGSILCGLYFFKNGKDFIKAASTAEKKNKVIEVSHILEEYLKQNKFKLIQAKGWYDCGNIENYYKARIDLLKVRSFNSVHYNDLYGHITKSGTNREKIIHEINWYQNVPTNLKIFTPRLISHTITSTKASYAIEFYGYQSLADFFVFGHMDTKLWQIVISRLFDILELFQKHKTKLPYKHYKDIYHNKTLLRLEKLKEDEYWGKLISQKNITINGKKYNNVNYFLQRLEKETKTLYEKEGMSFIHGDLCLGNILFDPSSKIFKFIDPRGSFGEMSFYGDTKYDIAKLRHSFSGYYDFISSDLFEIKENSEDSFVLKHFIDIHHEKIAIYFDKELIKRGYDIKKIKLIEALLFISMVPLHNDNIVRQKAMYLTGVRLLNENLD